MLSSVFAFLLFLFEILQPLMYHMHCGRAMGDAIPDYIAVG